MILSFGDKETEKLFNGEFSRKLPETIQRKALIKLVRMNSATTLKVLAMIPSNHLEPLTGKRMGEWSIRINSSGELLSHQLMEEQTILM